MCKSQGMSEQPVAATGVPEWDVADRMRKALRSSDLSVQEIADYLGVGRNTVSTWINGRIRPNKQTLRLWAIRTGVSFEWLENGEAPTAGGGGEGVRTGKLPRLDSNQEPAGFEFPQATRHLSHGADVLPFLPRRRIDERRSPQRRRTTRRGPCRTFAPIVYATSHAAS